MGGEATFAGTQYQAKAIAYVYAHMLAEIPLGWFRDFRDTPISVAGETRGPGDDFRILFGPPSPIVEVQAKHALNGGRGIDDVLSRLRAAVGGAEVRVVVTVPRHGASEPVHPHLANDLERIRDDRMDNLHGEATRILDANSSDARLLRRLSIVVLDVDREHELEAKAALHLLTARLVDTNSAGSAWDLLVRDAGDLCARRGSRNREQLVKSLELSGHKLRLRPAEELANQRLDGVRDLLNRRHTAAADYQLREIEKVVHSGEFSIATRFRALVNRAATHFQLEQFQEALVFARRAIDLKPNDAKALNSATTALLGAGRFEEAELASATGVTANPEDATAWKLAAQIAFAQQKPLPQPPETVCASVEYRTVLADIAFRSGDWAKSFEMAGQLLQEGDRSPFTLFLRANGQMHFAMSHPKDRQAASEVERLATELLETADNDRHPIALKGLALRSAARRLLGDVIGADCDIARATAAGGDRDALRVAALARAQNGETLAALELLQHPLVARDPVLLALRADLRFGNGDKAGARRDFDAAMQELKPNESPVAHLAVLEAALTLRELAAAANVHKQIPSDAVSIDYLVLTARLTAYQGNIDAAIGLYRDAAERNEPRRADILWELSGVLLRSNRAEECVATLRSLDERTFPPAILRILSEALVETNDLAGAHALLERLAAAGPLPAWGLTLATNIALQQANFEGATTHLLEIMARGNELPEAHLVLAECLLELGRNRDAEIHLHSLRANRSALSARQQAALAELLHRLSHTDEAFDCGLDAIRTGHQDPTVVRRMITLLLGSSVVPTAPTAIGENACFVIRSQSGAVRTHTVYAGGVDVRRNELSIQDAAAAGFAGLRVGGELWLATNGVNERWTVASVEHAFSNEVQHAIGNFEKFYGEPFFIQRVESGEPGGIGELLPLIRVMDARKQRAERVLSLYEARTLALGTVARLLGRSIVQTMDGLAETTYIKTEWRDAEGQSESKAAAAAATRIVLTRSSLATVFALDIADSIKSNYELCAPQSLRRELMSEARDLRELVAEGGAARAGSVDAESRKIPQQVAHHLRRLQETEAIINWLEREVKIVPRPLEAVGGARYNDTVEAIGWSSADALFIATHRGATLFADDLGLRAFFPKGARERSFSSVGLLHALAAAGKLRVETFYDLMLKLVSRKHSSIPPTIELLLAALRISGDQTMTDRAFALLGVLTPIEAARLAAKLIRTVALGKVLIVSLERVTNLALVGMAVVWPRQHCSQLLSLCVEDELHLLPGDLETTKRACVLFGRGAATV